tara:strand:+ start:25459 stop:25947 length:489 start_codon:yes stop_codon:yes gene_type:complete
MPVNDPLSWIFVLVVVFAAGLALIAVRGNLSLLSRVGALGLAGSLMLAGYAGLTELMSRPKPVSLEWVRSHENPAKVAASLLRENEAIYLWLVFKGETEPRAYRLPWNLTMAQQLREAQREAAGRQSEVMMKSLSGKTVKPTERMFYAPPRPAPPPKIAQAY